MLKFKQAEGSVSEEGRLRARCYFIQVGKPYDQKETLILYMNFDHIISDNIGLVHLIFSIVSLITGSLVLGLTKGTKKHKKIGYIYSGAMLVVLVTAFTMYNLFGTWGIFHWTAVVSMLTLALGLIPVLIRRPRKSYMSLHFSFMYWSVIGLYGAFMAETFVRLPKIVVESGVPNAMFYNMTGIAVAITMGFGAYYFIKLKSKWGKIFESKRIVKNNDKPTKQTGYWA